MSSGLDRPLFKVDGIERVTLDEETVLFHAGHLHRLNPTGSVVWDCIERGSAIDEVVTHVADAFGQPAVQVQEAVVSFCAELHRHGLLRGEDQAPSVVPGVPAPVPGPSVGPGEIPPRWEGTSERIRHRSGCFVALGYRFQIESTSASVGEFLSRIFGGLAADGSPDHGYVVAELADGRWGITLDGAGLHTATSTEAAIRHVVWHVNTEAIRCSEHHVIVHGAGASAEGRTVIFPGEMNAGKTTLAAGLLLAGFEYLSDELLAFDARGRVHPYARPLNIGRGSWEVLPSLRPPGLNPLKDQWFVNPLSVEEAVLGRASIPQLLIAPRYVPGARDVLNPLSKAAALELLHNQTLHPRPLDPETFQGLVATVRAVRCFRLSIGTLSGAVSVVRAAVLEDHEIG